MFISVISTILLVVLTTEQVQSQNSNHGKAVVCYVGTWSVYRPGNGKFDIKDIDPYLCTHVVYAFASLQSFNNTIKNHDDNRDFTLKGYQEFVNLKEKNPKLKVLLAIGGWEEGAAKYSWMSDSKENRTAFINSVVQFISQHKFDGLDLDWEYPGAEERGGRVVDKANFATLVQELYIAFQPRGWMLTAAIGASPRTINRAYNIPILSKYLDMINIMCYDYHGNWDKQTGHNAPLYPRSDESPDNQKLNINETVSLLLSLGAPPKKLILGVPFYGRTFTLATNSDFKVGAMTLGASGRPGQYSNQTGFMGYNEFCETMSSEQWTLEFDRHQKVPYGYRGVDWITYDDPDSLKLKVQFALEKQLGGIMIWSLETDDFRNLCKSGRYPLLNAINKALQSPFPVTTTTDMSNEVPNGVDQRSPLKMLIFLLLVLFYIRRLS